MKAICNRFVEVFKDMGAGAFVDISMGVWNNQLVLYNTSRVRVNSIYFCNGYEEIISQFH